MALVLFTGRLLAILESLKITAHNGPDASINMKGKLFVARKPAYLSSALLVVIANESVRNISGCFLLHTISLKFKLCFADWPCLTISILWATKSVLQTQQWAYSLPDFVLSALESQSLNSKAYNHIGLNLKDRTDFVSPLVCIFLFFGIISSDSEFVIFCVF